MALEFTLTQSQYEALVALARQGVSDATQRRALDAFLREIEKASGVTRHGLFIRWIEAGASMPKYEFPESWPPTMEAWIELITRPIAKADVMKVLAAKAKKPVNVMVTTDPAGLVGWALLEQYFP